MTASAHSRFTGNKYNPWDVFQPGFKGNLSDINASLLEFQINKEKGNTSKRKKNFLICIKRGFPNTYKCHYRQNLNLEISIYFQ